MSHTPMKRMVTVGSFSRNLVGEGDRQRGAAAEADDIDLLVARLEVVLQPVHHLADRLWPPKPNASATLSPAKVRAALPMPFRYRLPRSFPGSSFA